MGEGTFPFPRKGVRTPTAELLRRTVPLAFRGKMPPRRAVAFHYKRRGASPAADSGNPPHEYPAPQKKRRGHPPSDRNLSLEHKKALLEKCGSSPQTPAEHHENLFAQCDAHIWSPLAMTAFSPRDAYGKETPTPRLFRNTTTRPTKDTASRWAKGPCSKRIPTLAEKEQNLYNGVRKILRST